MSWRAANTSSHWAKVSFAGTDGAVHFKTVEVYHHEDGRFTERWFFVDRRQELDRLLDEIASR
jgi:hypothetical protein